MSAFDKFQASAKAFMGALAGAVVAVLFTTVTEPDAIVNPDAVPGANQLVQLPNTAAEWTTFAASVVVGFILPYAKRNFPSVVEARKAVKLAEERVELGKQQA